MPQHWLTQLGSDLLEGVRSTTKEDDVEALDSELPRELEADSARAPRHKRPCRLVLPLELLDLGYQPWSNISKSRSHSR